MRMEMEMTLEWKGMIGTGTWELGLGSDTWPALNASCECAWHLMKRKW